MKKRIKISMLLVLAIFTVKTSYSCMCMDYLLIDSLSQLKEYDFIAYVKITDDQNFKEQPKDGFGTIGLLTVSILEQFKGDKIEKILEYSKNTSCDIGISKGEEWVLFGKKINGKIAVVACDRSAKYKNIEGLRTLSFGADSYELRQLRKLYNHPIKTYRTEKRQEFYSNGQIEIEENYVNGKLNGECKKWYPNGISLAKSFYINDTIDGKSEEFYKTGQLESENYYLKGKKYNVSRYYYDSSEKASLRSKLTRVLDKNEAEIIVVNKGLLLNSERVYDCYGREIISRAFDRLGKIKNETIIDPNTKLKTSIYYHDNGMISSIGYSINYKCVGHYQTYKTDGSLDRGWDYDENGKAILNK